MEISLLWVVRPRGVTMTDDLINLARRAVASPHFRPMRGMIGIDGTVILSTWPRVETSEIVEWRDGGTMRRENRECTWVELLESGWLPDLLRSATLGCVHDLACEALGADAIDVSVGVAPDMSDLSRAMWTARSYRRRRRIASGSTLSRHVREAAYVAALEAAPAPEER